MSNVIVVISLLLLLLITISPFTALSILIGLGAAALICWIVWIVIRSLFASDRQPDATPPHRPSPR